MADDVNQVEEQIEENIMEDEISNHERFVSAKFHRLRDRIPTKNITKERDLLLKKISRVHAELLWVIGGRRMDVFRECAYQG